MAGLGGLGRLLVAGIFGFIGGGCFVGDAAKGLPCEQDGDCGLGVSCVEDPAMETKCCGGSCLLSSSSGPDASSSSSSSTEPTSLSTTESSSGPSVCGDGTVDLGEECEPESGSSLCGEDCRFRCGNGVVESGEQCDDEEPSCGGDCQFSMSCGNEVLEDGEACDVRLADAGTCLDDCKTWIALEWDGDEASSEFCVDESGSGLPGAWECTRWTDPSVAGARGSGAYFLLGDNWMGEPGTWPEAILRTRAIDFPAVGPEDTIEVEFIHELDFNSNPDEPEFVDYAELSLESATEDGPLRFVSLGGVAPLSVAISCSGLSSDVSCTSRLLSTDYCERGLVRTAGRTAGEEPVTAIYSPSGEPMGGLHRLRFLVRYDCSNFEEPGRPITPDAWVLHSLKVTVKKAGAGG